MNITRRIGSNNKAKITSKTRLKNFIYIILNNLQGFQKPILLNFFTLDQSVFLKDGNNCPD